VTFGRQGNVEMDTDPEMVSAQFVHIGNYKCIDRKTANVYILEIEGGDCMMSIAANK
jgi:hypothetical protein